MRNLFAFLRRHSILLLFLFTEVVCFSLLIQYNRYHQSVYLDYASELTGRIQHRYSGIESYFYLRSENEQLRNRINELQNQLKDNYRSPDTAQSVETRRILQDSSWGERKYVYRDAEVVNNSTSQPANYITLHRGAKQGIKPGMVVAGPLGVVGTVLDVSDNFAYVMSVLHKQSRISVRLKKTGEAGRLEWDGNDARYVQLKDIPKSTKPVKGDTIETSQYSDFPPGSPVGVIDQLSPETSTNYYSIRVRLFTDFRRIHHVFVIENLQREEQLELEQRTKPKR